MASFVKNGELKHTHPRPPQGAFKKREFLSLAHCFSWVNERHRADFNRFNGFRSFLGRLSAFMNSPCAPPTHTDYARIKRTTPLPPFTIEPNFASIACTTCEMIGRVSSLLCRMLLRVA